MRELIQYGVALVVVPTCIVAAMYAFAFFMRVKVTEWAANQVSLSLLERLLVVASNFWMLIAGLLVGAWYLLITVIIIRSELRKDQRNAS